MSVYQISHYKSLKKTEKADKAIKTTAIADQIKTTKWIGLTHIKQQITNEKKA